tara:strand:- start:194 stop:379 length:186 start_codon:yes stop_codon:yes gene_type:complete
MSYSYIYGQYFYLPEVIEMIEKIEIDRSCKRLKGEKMDITFADQLKNLLNGIQEEKIVRLS